MRTPALTRAALTAGAVAQFAPMLTSIAPFRRAALPRLSAMSALPHIALTYDDGPDPASTPRFLDLLKEHDVSATFFLLGALVRPNRHLVKEMSEAGHELAVHGWDHTCLALKQPGLISEELRRSRDAIEGITGEPVTWFRPPYGVITGEGMLAARRTGLQTVLWSAWGRDWSPRATPESIAAKVSGVLEPGGTVLLHDTDRTSSPGSWERTLAASDHLLRAWSEQGTAVGPLRQHWPTS